MVSTGSYWLRDTALVEEEKSRIAVRNWTDPASNAPTHCTEYLSTLLTPDNLSMNIGKNQGCGGTQACCLPGDDGEMGRAHARAHKQNHILMPSLPVGHHFPLESLQLVLIIPLNVDEADGHLAMPAAVKHLAKTAIANQFTNL